MLSDRVRSWLDEGAIEEVLGRELFVRRRGGGETLLLFLHGFPSSSYDWRPLLGLRPPDEASVAFDFLGFGLSEKPRDHEYTLAWQADAAEEIVRRAAAQRVFVVGRGAARAGRRAPRCRGVETIELPDAGHYPQIEQPELISAALDTALARTAG